MKALHVLRTLFPPHFDAWYRSTTILDDHEKTQTIPWINLAQRFGAYPFLPAMFINCCALSEEELASGFRTADGATHYLPPEDLVRHRNLSRELCSSVPPALYRALEKFTSLCTEHPDTCSAGVAAAAQDIKATFFRAPGVPNDPFPRWGRYSKKMARHGVCAECEGLLENRWKEELGAIWSTLPQIMNLQLSGQQVLTGSVDSQLPDGVVS
ncbi:hypothetical protein BD310DRAFT_673953 [Dichomitus squalens]|uniref:Uncharacterized protein n=1 Tax=Dichomitus squalens TaxID=114155 RepID=A0A4Q9PNH6_9APHY|nr:hypothetical protein BD310DRAFT_673953 [Dichomitus squalens]